MKLSAWRLEKSTAQYGSVAALAIYLFIENDATVVIPAILRKKTGQDSSVPAVSTAAHSVLIEFDENEINGDEKYQLSHSIS